MRASAPFCLRRILAIAGLALGCSLGVGAGSPCVSAQVLLPAPTHVYPLGSQMGFASFGAGPSLQVNCVTYPLGPGLRVENTRQRLVLRGQLAGLRGPAVFQRDAMGNVFQVWMLAPGQTVEGVPAAPNHCLFQQY